MTLTDADRRFFDRAIELAADAERQGNLPIGGVIVCDGEIIAEGQNAIFQPHFDGNRHAEIEALRNVPSHLWQDSKALTLYTTLEPCLMCVGAILLHKVGRVLYGSGDSYGGGSRMFGQMPTYFEEEIAKTEWIGPVYPERCDPLRDRLEAKAQARRAARRAEHLAHQLSKRQRGES